MRPLDPCLAIAERLLTLSLVLEDAVAQGRIEELDVTLADRQKLLDELESYSLSPAARKTILAVQAIETNTASMLERLRNEGLGEIKKLGKQKRGLNAYQAQSAA